MTREEVKSCFEYLQSLGLKTTTDFGGINDSRFYTEDLDSIQWIARYEYLYKRFKVVATVEVERRPPFCIVTYNAKNAETPHQFEVMVKYALELLDNARKSRIELIKERKTKQIESAAEEWSA
jgi:hypothetical protein